MRFYNRSSRLEKDRHAKRDRDRLMEVLGKGAPLAEAWGPFLTPFEGFQSCSKKPFQGKIQGTLYFGWPVLRVPILFSKARLRENDREHCRFLVAIPRI